MSRPKITYINWPSIRWIDIDRAPKNGAPSSHSDLSLYNTIRWHRIQMKAIDRLGHMAMLRLDSTWFPFDTADATADAFKPHWCAVLKNGLTVIWYHTRHVFHHSKCGTPYWNKQTDNETTQRQTNWLSTKTGLSRTGIMGIIWPDGSDVATGSAGAYSIRLRICQHPCDRVFERPDDGRTKTYADIWQIRLRLDGCGLCCGKSVVFVVPGQWNCVNNSVVLIIAYSSANQSFLFDGHNIHLGSALIWTKLEIH